MRCTLQPAVNILFGQIVPHICRVFFVKVGVVVCDIKELFVSLSELARGCPSKSSDMSLWFFEFEFLYFFGVFLVVLKNTWVERILFSQKTNREQQKK